MPHLYYFPRLYEHTLLNPHKKYTGNILLVFKPRYPTKEETSINFSHFQYLLDEEYKRIRDEYLVKINYLEKTIKKETKYDWKNVCFYSIFDLHTNNIDDSKFIIDDYYAPIDLHNTFKK